jgi:hypothetical protein
MTDVASIGPAAGDLVITPQGYVGLLSGTSTALPAAWGVLNYTYQTDSQSLLITLGDQGHYDQAATYGYTHCDTGFTVGAYYRISNDQIVVGSFTRSGSVFTYTPFAGGTFAATVSTGSPVEFYNNGTSWLVAVLGTQQTFTVSNSSVTFSGSRRTAAVSMERKNSSTAVGNYPAGDFDSFRIAGITMSDYVSPTFVGSGGKMSSSSAAINLSAVGGLTALPNSFFDTATSSADVTTDLTHGKYTVSFNGWYKVSMRLQAAVSYAAGVSFSNGFLHNGVSGALLSSELGHTSGAVLLGDGFHSSHIIYLGAGESITAAYLLTNSVTNAINGAGPTGTYFNLALLTKTLAAAVIPT